MATRRKPDWSELYPELLAAIATRFETLNDLRHCKSVCTNWRRSLSSLQFQKLPLLSPNFPYKLTNLPFVSEDDDFSSSASIVCNSTFLLQPRNPDQHFLTNPWLFTVEELNPGSFFLRKPLTGVTIEKYPDYFSRDLDLSQCNVKEIRRDYTLRYYSNKINVLWSYTKFTDRLVLFFNPVQLNNFSVNDCHALMLHNDDLFYVSLHDVNDYGFLRSSRVSKFDDIVIYKNRVWVIDRKGRIHVISYSDNLKMIPYSVHGISSGSSGATRKRLVESSQGLYMIYRYNSEELIKFKVYKLNEVELKWEEIKSFDGRILFVLSDCCFFGNAQDFPGCRGNCIVFPKNHFPTYSGSSYTEDLYFNEARKELEIGVFTLDDGESGLVSNYPGLSNLFWPPPKWLFPGWDGEEEENIPDCSKDCPEFMSIQSCDPSALDVQEQSDEGAPDMQLKGADVVPWTDIPINLLTKVAKFLEIRSDVCRFRGVCKTWRASCPPPLNRKVLSSLFPYEISTTLASYLMDSSNYKIKPSLSLVASTTYLLHPCGQSSNPSKSWLVTVEELNPGKLILQLPLRTTPIKQFPEDFPKFLSISNIHVMEISKDYRFHNINSKFSMFNYLFGGHKVVLFTNKLPSSPTNGDTSALVLYQRGNLVSIKLSSAKLQIVRYGPVVYFDDILNMKGKIYAIDRKARVYTITCDGCSVCRITNGAISSDQSPDRQKRLVEFHGELYLLVRYSPRYKIYFRVYKLNVGEQKWDEVGNLGSKILFVTPGTCFFVCARDCPGWRGNCIVFPENCLPSYSGNSYPDRTLFRRSITELKIGVFHLGQTDGAKQINSYPGYSDLLWPPPAWLQSFASSSGGEHDPPCLQNQEKQDSLEPFSKLTEENYPTIAQQDIAGERKKESDPKAPEISTVMFQGVMVRSYAVPILQKIWAKYGNIAEGITTYNSSMTAKTFEFLADTVYSLNTTPGRSFDHSHVVRLKATLEVLQSMQLRVDWLVPFVEKAAACEMMKTHVNDLEGLEMSKARIQVMKKEVLELEQLLDDQTRSVQVKINNLGPIDLDECLGVEFC